jgi:Fe2+ transport system protein FeoA
MTLDELKKGQMGRVTNVRADCNCVLRIMTLGIVEGSQVKTASTTKYNMEIWIHSRNKMALSKHCARKVTIVV